MKRIAILTIALWSVSNLFASIFQIEPLVRINERSTIEELTENWLQNQGNTEETSGGLRGAIGGGEKPGGGDLSVPVDGIPWASFILCGGLYLMCRQKKGINHLIQKNHQSE